MLTLPNTEGSSGATRLAFTLPVFDMDIALTLFH